MGKPGGVLTIDRRALSTFLVAAGLLAAAPPASALEELAGARSLGLGMARVASPDDNGSIYFNPAGISLGQKYSFEFGYSFTFEGKGSQIVASLVDSKSSPVGGGTSFSYVLSSPGELSRRGMDVRVALSYPITERLMIGLTNKYVRLNIDPRDDGGDDEEDDGAEVNTYAIDFGLLARFADRFLIGVVGYNLTNPNTDELPLKLAAGLSWGVGGFSISAEYQIDFTTLNLDRAEGEKRSYGHNVRAGAEYFFSFGLAVRAGYMLEGADGCNDEPGCFGTSHAVTMGVSYVSTNFGVDAAYKREVAGVGKDNVIGLSLRLFL